MPGELEHLGITDEDLRAILDEPPDLDSLGEEADARYEALRHNTTLDLYRLAMHALGGVDSVIEVPDDMPDEIIEKRRHRYLRALAFADGLHDKIEEVFRDNPQLIGVRAGKFYRLRHRVPGNTRVKLIKRADNVRPLRVQWRGKDYWVLKIAGSFWLADGQRGKLPSQRMSLEEIYYDRLGDSIRSDVPSTFVVIENGTPTYRGVPLQRWFHWQGRPWKKGAPSFDEAWMTSDKHAPDEDEIPPAQGNYTALYAVIDRLASLQANLVWDWYFAGMTYKELRREYRIPENKLRDIIRQAVSSLECDPTRQTARTPTWTGAHWVRYGLPTVWPFGKADGRDPRASLAWDMPPSEHKTHRPLNLDAVALTPKKLATQLDILAKELGAAPPGWEIEKTWQWVRLNPVYEAWRRTKVAGAYRFRVVKYLGLDLLSKSNDFKYMGIFRV
jgi:hypothetical protein